MTIPYKNKKILLVEDEQVTALLEKKELTRAGYNVQMVHNGKDAVNFIKAGNDVELILMDIDLGSGIDGTRAAELILKRKEIPIVFLSSHTEPEIVRKTENISSYGYVVKNTGITVLDASIKMAFRLFDEKNAVKESRAEYEVLSATLRDAQFIAGLGNYTCDLKTGEVTWSEGMYKLLRYNKNEHIDIKRVNREIHHPDDLEGVTKWLNDAISSGKKKIRARQYRLIRKDGRIIDVQGEGRIEYIDGVAVRVFGTILDITKQKSTEERLTGISEKYRETNQELRVLNEEFEATNEELTASNEEFEAANEELIETNRELIAVQEKLRESEEKYRLAFQTSPDSVNINAIDGTYVDINDGFTRLTGYTRREVIGISSKEIDIWAIPEDRERLIAGLTEKGSVENLESLFRCKDGSFKTALMSARIIHLEGGPHILSITRDITEMRDNKKALMVALEEKNSLLRELQHRVKNTLSMIIGLIKLKRESVQCGETENALDELETRLIAIDQLYNIIHETGRSDGIDIGIYCSRIIESLVDIAGQVDIRSDFVNGEMSTKRATLIGLIAIELITNSIKHAFKEGEKGSIDIELTRDCGQYMLLIHDSGSGIGDDFDHRVKEGLGIELVQNMAVQLGGRLDIPEKGNSRFAVLFPEFEEE